MKPTSLQDILARRIVALLLCTAMAGTAQAEEVTTGDMFADALIARPVGLFLIAAGTGLFVVTLPFTIPSGSVPEAAEKLVGVPLCRTFLRPLGHRDYPC
jgi:hypothetical protein